MEFLVVLDVFREKKTKKQKKLYNYYILDIIYKNQLNLVVRRC